MAGFQVIIIGRFWVFTEGRKLLILKCRFDQIPLPGIR